MKKIILTLCVALLSIAAGHKTQAQDAGELVTIVKINRTDGRIVRYGLPSSPVVDFVGDNLVVSAAEVEELDDAVLVRRSRPLERTNIKTLPYPGFPTDMQPQVAACLCIAQGTSVLTEGVWDNRYRYVDEFRRMGAQIQVDGKVAVIEGVDHLTGAPVHACDLRAGAAMIIAGLAAQGTTEIDGIHHIERGYETIVEKLANLGADIQIISVPGEDDQSQVG